MTAHAASVELTPPFRDFAVDALRRSDGTIVLSWSGSACDIVEGPASADAPMTLKVPNVSDWLRVWAIERPDVLFMAERNADGAWDGVTYSQAWERVRRIAWQLIKTYDTPWDPLPRLAIVSPNSLRQALLTLAAMHVGIVVAPVSPAYAQVDGDPARLRTVFDALSPGLVYTERPERTASALAALSWCPSAQVIDAAMLDDWMRVDHRADDIVDIFHREARGERIAKIMFTSGSTGTPRGVPMSHGMLAAAQATTAAMWSRASRRPQVYLEWLPWHHVMGGNVELHRVLRQGATAYLDAGKPVAALFHVTLKNLRDIAPTFYFNVPLGYALLVPELERDAALAQHFFSRLEYVAFGGSTLSSDLIRRLQDLSEATTGRRIVVTSAYGATETCGPGLMTPHSSSRHGSLGLPAPGVTAKLVPHDDRYELRLSASAISGRYLGQAAASTEVVDEEGFYRTGDAVKWVDDDDLMQGLAFAGRISEDFKLTSGTWVNAARCASGWSRCFHPLVSDAVLTGHDRETVGALVFVDDAACRAHCGVPADMQRGELVRQPALLEELATRLDRFNAQAGSSSTRVERLMLLTESPVAEAFEVTDKGYLNQRAILQRRAGLVEALYGAPLHAGVVVSTKSAGS